MFSAIREIRGRKGTMSDITIRVEGLSKQYRIGGPQARYKTIRESLTEAVQAPFRCLSSILRGQSSAVSNETFWALKDVSLRGETRRGGGHHRAQRGGEDDAAQNPLPHHRADGGLRRDPRAGGLAAGGGHRLPPRVDRAGEHLPERRHLGDEAAEIEHKFDEIVAFAEIEKFIDTPVKHYSSGMYVRLAFAVAAHLEPEILRVAIRGAEADLVRLDEEEI
jgi:lipopolysaccharide transport system ATP-binding protein